MTGWLMVRTPRTNLLDGQGVLRQALPDAMVGADRSGSVTARVIRRIGVVRAPIRREVLDRGQPHRAALCP
jgi:hypothetical protein